MSDFDFDKLDARRSICWLPLDGQFRQDVGESYLIDGDMEDAGIGAYTEQNSDTSKEGGAHSGSQCLRVAQNGLNGNAKAIATATGSAGKRVHGSVWVKGDGVASARVYLGTEFFYENIWTPFPTTWTLIDRIATGGDAFNLYAYLVPSVAGPYIEYDDASLFEYPRVTRSLSKLSNTLKYARMGNGHTSTTFPTQRSDRGITFDGGDYVNLDWAAGSALDTQTFTVCALVKPTLPVADGRIYEVGIAGKRYSLYYDISAGTIVWEKDDTVDQTITSGYGGASFGQPFAVAASISNLGMKLTVEDRLVGSIAGDVRLANFDVTSKAIVGADAALGNFYKGGLYGFAIYPFELSPAQIREWSRRAKQLRGV